MPSFTRNRPLTSLQLDLDVLRRLESLLRSLLPSLGVADSEFPYIYSVSITDAVGTEVVQSIEEYLPAQFPDSIVSVSVRLHAIVLAQRTSESRTFQLSVNFGRARNRSALEITAKGEDARALAITVGDAIERLLEPYRTTAWRFWPTFGWDALLLIVISFSSVFFLSFLATVVVNGRRDYLPSTIWAFVALLIGLGYYFARKWRPWTDFDSRLDQERRGSWSYWRNGFLAFIVFGTLLPFFRRLLVGF